MARHNSCKSFRCFEAAPQCRAHQGTPEACKQLPTDSKEGGNEQQNMGVTGSACTKPRAGQSTAKVLQHRLGIPVTSGYSLCSGQSPTHTVCRCRGAHIGSSWAGRTTKPKPLNSKMTPGGFLKAVSSKLKAYKIHRNKTLCS